MRNAKVSHRKFQVQRYFPLPRDPQFFRRMAKGQAKRTRRARPCDYQFWPGVPASLAPHRLRALGYEEIPF